MLITGLLGLGIGTAYAAGALTEKQSSPNIQEHLTKETIASPLIRKEGTLMRKEGEYYYIKDNDGIVQKLHVDKTTKSDNVLTGDSIKAYVTNQGHTATLQRDY